MPQGAFFEQKRMSPTSLAIVVALHGAAIGALLLAKGPVFEKKSPVRTIVYQVPDITPPEVEPETRPEPRTQPQPQHRSPIEAPPPIVDIPSSGPQVQYVPLPPIADVTPPGRIDLPGPPVAAQPEPVPEPVRVEARPDPRFAGDLQPPYPAAEERAGREGTVRIRVTIGADGRVKAAERVSATSDAFWRATERQALSRWRFRPATLDGRPVASEKVMTVHFQLRDR